MFVEAHAWQFFRAGGVDQVLIRSGADLAHLGALDQKLWVALACPTRGTELDPRTLDLIDTDRDGRIRPPELIAACEWACRHLQDPDLLMQGGDGLALAAIADGDEAGTPLADEARRILQLRGKEGADTLSLADVTDRADLLAAMRFNGDGVVPPASAEDETVRAVIEHIMKTHGRTKDRNGLDGVRRSHAEAFFAELQALHAWYAGAGSGGEPSNVASLAAAQGVGAVREKVDDYFARCRLAAYDSRSIDALNPTHETYEALAAQGNLRSDAQSIAALPLAPVAPGRSLPLRDGVNPAWADELEALRRDAVVPLLGRTGDDADRLTEDDWCQLCKRVAPCGRWLAARPVTKLGAMTADAVTSALAQQGAVVALIDQDEAVEPHNARMADLEKLLRLKRDLLTLVNNFVSFKDFYRREGAIFQAGRLYLDGRSCDLSVTVADAAKHAALAGLAKAYLAYCRCTRQGKTMTVVSAFTAGDTDFLFVGRNGVFYDREGADWDATIVKVIENPTSVGQAFFSPYKKFVRLVEEQVARRAAASDTLAQGSLGTLATHLTTADTAAAPGAKPPAPLKLPGRVDVGTVAALGVALGSISAVLVAVSSKFVDLGVWLPIALLGIVLAISGPSMLIAWLKLRQRSLGPILDASGWAINGRMRVNVRLGGSLSQTARLPAHAHRALRDPYADSHRGALLLVVLCLAAALGVLAWRMRWLDPALPPAMQRTPPPVSAPAG